MKLVLLVNPTASSVTPNTQVMVAKMLDKAHELEILLTDGRGHATELTAQASKGEAEAIIVFGGDGTLNEVANGLAGTEMNLGVLPGGSTNVFSRILGQSDDPIAATEQVLDAVAARSFHKVNLGKVNERVFLFHVGVGFDARVVEKVERKPDLKKWVAHPLFVYKAFSTWMFDFDKTRPHFNIEFEGEDPIQGYLSVCLNANPYTYLGSIPFDLAPKDAGLNKELVAVNATSMKAMSILRFVRKGLLSKKGFRRVSDIKYKADLSRFRIYSDEEFPYQADGDFLGYTTELNFSHIPAGLNLIARQGSTHFAGPASPSEPPSVSPPASPHMPEEEGN